MTQSDEQGIKKTPPNLLEFLGIEEQQLLVSLVRTPEITSTYARLEGLFRIVISNRVSKEDDLVIFQLLTFIHYHLLFTMACQMRCHLSEAFASSRVAIDAALIAAVIIKDRSQQVHYLRREKPFDKLPRHLKNLLRDGKPLPHRLIPTLLNQHDRYSSISSHADIDTFVHRVRTSTDQGGQVFAVEYFQFARDDDERRLHVLTLLHTYVMVLDVFTDFLVVETKVVDADWRNQLVALGTSIENAASRLRAALQARHAKAPERS